MNRRGFLKAAGLGAASLVVPNCTAAPRRRSATSRTHQKPNIVFILIDDMGWPDVACYGSKFHETPNVDRLASQGMKFSDAYAACPVCSPTRASIMAGQYPARIGITDFIPGHWRPYEKLIVPENRLELPLESVTIGEALKEQGYATCYIGKWHLGDKGYSPDKQGFDKFVLGVKNQNDKQVSGFTDEAIKFIEEKKQEPFFLYLSHHSVHIKLEAPEELVNKYKKKPKPPAGVNNPVYAAMVEHLDTHTGRILKKLDDLDLAERTIVIFFSDNGGLREAYGGYGGPRQIVSTNAPLRDEKGTLYEGGIREPLIVRWPGVVKSGTECNIPVTSVDFYPTFLEIVGAKGSPNQPLDGESILPLLRQTGTLDRDAIYWHYPHYHHSRPAGAIREGDYKLIEFYEDGRLELYDLANDIGEEKNFATEMPQKAAQLQQKLARWRRSVKAKMPTVNPDYDPARADEWKPRPRR
ncbi:MAG: sulfatase-like hydrolase/transferase [Phycisphaerae bacterium]|nr:sulfatase-like hydrolase/transferase [Phycisphaerae bacterium]